MIAQASLEGLREQNRLSALVASYVAVTTARQSRFGLSAQKTLIMPGRVRYEVDPAKLEPRDAIWNAGAKTLDMVLPPVEVVGPEIDLTRIREYDGGGLLLRLTDAAAALDAANRRAGQAELLRCTARRDWTRGCACGAGTSRGSRRTTASGWSGRGRWRRCIATSCWDYRNEGRATCLSSCSGVIEITPLLFAAALAATGVAGGVREPGQAVRNRHHTRRARTLLSGGTFR